MPAVLLGGCQTITTLGDHTAATLGFEDEPHAYTSSVVSEPKRSGICGGQTSPWRRARGRGRPGR